MTDVIANTPTSELRALARFTRFPALRVEGRDRLIRFLDAFPGVTEYQAIVDSLCIHFGLFPYLSPAHDSLSTAEALAYEYHRPAIQSRDADFVFHADQAAVFYRLLDRENIILSAPTSFGKSAILDALVASEQWGNIVVIVPSVALIDEVRRRLVLFSDRYNLVTHPTQTQSDRNIYILTQERFLELPEQPKVDLFMIDEFYKLSAQNTDDQRMSMLNIAWNQLRKTGAQYYLAGPNVSSLAEALDDDLRESLYVSQYRTVAVDIEDRSEVPDELRLEDMSNLWPKLDGSTLLFVSSPQRAERVAIEVSRFSALSEPTAFAGRVADWLALNFHPSWRLVEALRNGVGTHTGPLPRSLQRVMIRLFSAEHVSALVCTTTLIEGVNTSARNVIIYDKKIDRKPIDYFTFSNVRGRAGRMSSHFLGRVITYMPPPEEALMEVDIPIDSQTLDAPLSALVQLDEKDLTSQSQLRLNEIRNQDELSVSVIQRNRGFDPDQQIEAARLLKTRPDLSSAFAWSGFPTNQQARNAIEFAFRNLLASGQKRGMNFERLWGMLNAVRDSQGDLVSLVNRQLPYAFPGDDTSDVVAGMLAFQRNWMGFTIPSMLRALERIHNDVAKELHRPQANYEFYISQIESLFLRPGLLDLDEYGLPLPLALKFLGAGMESGDAATVLRSFVALAQDDSVRSSLSEIELWIVNDVLGGLGIFDVGAGPNIS